MRTVKWCLSFGVVFAGVVVGYSRPCHECDVAPLPSMRISFDGGCCEEGCGCCKDHATEVWPAVDGCKDYIPPMTREQLNAMQATGADKTDTRRR
jgi:hypothetical protein